MVPPSPKFIFVTGGVLSSLGKGILASSIAKLLKAGGINASIMKIDPYLNCDAGTLNPYEHGEVFVTQDGFECDLDLGNYERFLGINAKREQNMMLGSVYKTILDKERKGDFLGKTLQLIPHATNEIKSRIRRAAQVTGAEVLTVEVGGTVGDIESEIVLEAVRQLRCELPRTDTLSVHLALVPTILTGEQKTKPLQHSVKALLSRGILPDLIIGRSDRPLGEGLIEKISLQCNVSKHDVYCSPTMKTVYEIPFYLKRQGIHENIAQKMGLTVKEPMLDSWQPIIDSQNSQELVRIGVAGKYAYAKDAYMSVFEALTHAGATNGVQVQAELLDSEAIERGQAKLDQYDGFVIPGGFGARGVEGKIITVRHCRENNVPILGICYGFQMQVIETARNLLGMKGAHTTEIDAETPFPVIDLLPEQKAVVDKGGTMRLGARNVQVKKNTIAHKEYGNELIFKRFRHRYEMNPEFIRQIESTGMLFSGFDPDGQIMKILELPEHPFFFGVQFHPEFDSRPDQAEPAFNALIRATKQQKEAKALK